MTMAIAVSSMCWTSAGCSVSPQCSRTHSGQNQPLFTSHELPLPKFGMTGPPARITRGALPS